MLRSICAVMGLIALISGCGDQSENYLQAGFAHFQEHDYDQAIENYEKAIALGTKSPGAYNMLGLSYRFKFQQTGKPELQQNEIDAFQKAVNLDPEYWVAMVNLGTTHYSRGEKAQAAAWFKKALATNPNHQEKAQIEKMIAEGARKSQSLNSAGKPVLPAQPLVPDGRDTATAEKYLQEGGAHFQKQEYDEAIKCYKKAIKLDPKNALAYEMLEMSYASKASQNSNKRRRRAGK